MCREEQVNVLCIRISCNNDFDKARFHFVANEAPTVGYDMMK